MRPPSSKPASPAKTDRGESPQKQQPQEPGADDVPVQPDLQRDTSNASVESRDKSVVWDSLWSLDVSYPGK
jgi:hypothetical protein